MNSSLSHLVQPLMGEVENARLRKGLRLGARYTVSRHERVALDFHFRQLDDKIAEDRDLFFWTSFVAAYHTHGVLDGKKSDTRRGK